MNFLYEDLENIEKKEQYKDSHRTENCIKQRNLLAKLFLELKYRMLEVIDFFPDATVIFNKEGKVIAWNRAMEEFTNIQSKFP